jgi:hypothetical protein
MFLLRGKTSVWSLETFLLTDDRSAPILLAELHMVGVFDV